MSARRFLPAAGDLPAPFSERERRWLWATELPALVAVIAVAVVIEPQRSLDPIVCAFMVVAYAVACQVVIALPDSGDAPSTQLVFVPMLLLAPLNLVPLLVLGGNLLDRCAACVLRRERPERVLLALGNSAYAVGPVLVLAAAGYDAFAWSDWPLYAAALAAQLAFTSLVGIVRVRLHLGSWMSLETHVAPTAIDIVLSLPALGVVAIAGDAPVAAVLMTAAMLSIATGFTSEHSRRLAERDRAALDARRALLDERLRIARELHDVVAHHVSVIGVQAGAARVVLDRDPATAKATLSLIESSSRDAVRELHQLLGFLRQEGDADDIGPQPGLGQIGDLAIAMSDSQLAVEVHVEGEPVTLTPTVDASAYRIVQEALTNTLKHASATRADVHLRYRPGTLELEIVDDGRPNGVVSSPGGLGLVGMRERAALHGGQLKVGPRTGGGFSVRATLPAGGGGA